MAERERKKKNISHFYKLSYSEIKKKTFVPSVHGRQA